MWLPKCCSTPANIIIKLNRPVQLYIRELKVYTDNQGNQKSTWSAGTLVQTRMCYIKDRSTASQETSILTEKTDPSTSKELIFANFPIDNIQINEVRWEGMKMNFLGITKISSTSIEGKRYYAPNGAPFISMIVGVNKV